MSDVKRQYVATLRASFEAEDDAQALLIADDIATQGLDKILEAEEGDTIIVTQVIDYAPADTPQEIINVLAKARNTLILTKMQPMIDLAREVDKVIFSLEKGDWVGFAPYDYGRFMELIELVINGGAPA